MTTVPLLTRYHGNVGSHLQLIAVSAADKLLLFAAPTVVIRKWRIIEQVTTTKKTCIDCCRGEKRD